MIEDLSGQIKLMVVWLYSGNPLNWGGIKEMETGMGGKLDCEFVDDDYVQLECIRKFKVKNIEEGKNIMRENKLELQDCEVFSVIDSCGKVVFTEEDL